ncbi:retrovirus-related pol polyprotein from transposon TNT 1-94 [Tanacetum coccineum]
MACDEPKKGGTDDASSSQQRKLISPFDITTLDNPRLVITQVQLKGDNYDEWSRSFRTAIRAQKKFGFIDGTIERLGEKDKDKDNPGLCVCKLGAVFEKKQEEEKVHTFLMSLDESVYGTARSNILAQDPLPNLNKVYSILIQEERVNTMVRGKDERPELMALAMQNRTEAKNRSVICTEYMKLDIMQKSALKFMGIQNGGEIDHVLIQKGMVLEEDCRLDAGKVEAVEVRLEPIPCK